MSQEIATIWTTKYLFTKGIQKIENSRISRGENYVMAYHPEKKHEYYSGNNLHFTEQEAIKKAEIQVEKKIKKLKADLQKLESIKFE